MQKDVKTGMKRFDMAEGLQIYEVNTQEQFAQVCKKLAAIISSNVSSGSMWNSVSLPLQNIIDSMLLHV